MNKTEIEIEIKSKLDKNALERAKPVTCYIFCWFRKTMGSYNSFTLIENNSRFLR